jgi:hypothetical protein
LAFSAGSPAHAGPIVVPPSLHPGDHYQLMFVTSATRTALSSNIDDYNSFVTTQAAGLTTALGQPVSWHAIASTPTVDARDNAPQLDSVYDLQGHRITAFDAVHGLYHTATSDLEQPPNVDETGSKTVEESIWTGTRSTGQGATSGRELGGGNLFHSSGDDARTSGDYLGDSGRLPKENHPLYGLSTDLVVAPSAVPEPTSFILLGMGTVVLMAYRRLSNGPRRSEVPGHPESLPNR